MLFKFDLGREGSIENGFAAPINGKRASTQNRFAAPINGKRASTQSKTSKKFSRRFEPLNFGKKGSTQNRFAAPINGKRASTQWTVGKLVALVLLVVFLVIVIIGLSTGFFNPMIEKFGALFDGVSSLFGGDVGGGEDSSDEISLGTIMLSPGPGMPEKEYELIRSYDWCEPLNKNGRNEIGYQMKLSKYDNWYLESVVNGVGDEDYDYWTATDALIEYREIWKGLVDIVIKYGLFENYEDYEKNLENFNKMTEGDYYVEKEGYIGFLQRVGEEDKDLQWGSFNYEVGDYYVELKKENSDYIFNNKVFIDEERERKGEIPYYIEYYDVQPGHFITANTPKVRKYFQNKFVFNYQGKEYEIHHERFSRAHVMEGYGNLENELNSYAEEDYLWIGGDEKINNGDWYCSGDGLRVGIGLRESAFFLYCTPRDGYKKGETIWMYFSTDWNHGKIKNRAFGFYDEDLEELKIDNPEEFPIVGTWPYWLWRKEIKDKLMANCRIGK